MSETYKQKRVLDLLVAGAATVVALPVAAVAAAAIAADDGRPILFKQQRVGRDGKLFTIYKFRTMDTSAPNVPSAQSTGNEITRTGRVLRRLSIDELPQLINVYAGQMSIVGPRPALPSQVDVLSARKAAGVDGLTPGVTGLAQVTSYDGMTAAEKVRRDHEYACAQSLKTDLEIIAKTLLYLGRTPPQY